MSGLSDLYQSIADSFFPRIVPAADQAEVITVWKADDTTIVWGVSTNGTPRMEITNGAAINGFSDAYTTLKFSLSAASGNIWATTIQSAGTIQATGVISGASLVITGAITGATNISASLDVDGRSVTLTGAEQSQSSGGLNVGGQTSATIGTTGAAAALPANPLGYIKAFLGTTPIKIPYYTA